MKKKKSHQKCSARLDQDPLGCPAGPVPTPGAVFPVIGIQLGKPTLVWTPIGSRRSGWDPSWGSATVGVVAMQRRRLDVHSLHHANSASL